MRHRSGVKGLRSEVGWCVIGVGSEVGSLKSGEEIGRAFLYYGFAVRGGFKTRICTDAPLSASSVGRPAARI